MRWPSSLLRCLLVVLAIAASPSRSAKPSAKPSAQRVAVYDLEANDVPPLLGRVLTDAVVEEVRKLEGTAVVGMSEIRAMLDHEAQKQLAGCSEDSCISEIAEAIGVDLLVIGSVSAIGTDAVFLLKGIDQHAARTAASFTTRAALGDDETLLAQVGEAVATLFPDRPLRPGASRGVSERLAKRLRPPPLPPAVWYATLGTTGVAIAGAAALSAPAMLSVQRFEAYKADPSHKDAYELREHTSLGEEAQAWVVGAIGAWSFAGLGAVLTLATWPLTDFEGEGEAP